ncbi:hypothetical protein pb186bvf_003147 [Paramecium bursaria]
MIFSLISFINIGKLSSFSNGVQVNGQILIILIQEGTLCFFVGLILIPLNQDYNEYTQTTYHKYNKIKKSHKQLACNDYYLNQTEQIYYPHRNLTLSSMRYYHLQIEYYLNISLIYIIQNDGFFQGETKNQVYFSFTIYFAGYITDSYLVSTFILYEYNQCYFDMTGNQYCDNKKQSLDHKFLGNQYNAQVRHKQNAIGEKVQKTAFSQVYQLPQLYSLSYFISNFNVGVYHLQLLISITFQNAHNFCGL